MPDSQTERQWRLNEITRLKMELDLLETEGQFEEFRKEQYKKGAVEYGRFGYEDLSIPVLLMMFKEELADVANYAQMLFVKICQLEKAYNAMDAYRTAESTSPNEGSFTPDDPA
jgi:hypothetical protein